MLHSISLHPLKSSAQHCNNHIYISLGATIHALHCNGTLNFTQLLFSRLYSTALQTQFLFTFYLVVPKGISGPTRLIYDGVPSKVLFNYLSIFFKELFMMVFKVVQD